MTVGKRRHPLPRPFFCIGTMNPHDNTGTFEMAHASCDRFAMRTGIGYPSESGERDLLQRFGNADQHDKRSHRGPRRRRAVAAGDREAPRRASPCAPISCACCVPRATIRTSSSAPRRVRSSRCSAAPRPPRCSTTPPRSPSSTCAASSSPASRIASVSARTPRRARSARRSSSARPCRSRPAAEHRREAGRPRPELVGPARCLPKRGYTLAAGGAERRCSSTTGSSRSSCHQRASRFSMPTNARSASLRPEPRRRRGSRRERATRAPRRRARRRAAASGSSGVVPVSRMWMS